MRPHSDADAPALDIGVEKRLRRLDPNLLATFSKFVIDPFNGQPVIGPHGPVHSPGWNLWRKQDDYTGYLFVMTLPRLGHREVAKLEGDVARTMSHSEIAKRHHERWTMRQKKLLQQERDLKNETIKANKSRIHDLIFEGKTGRRQAKPFSAPGVTRRSTPGEYLAPAREDGWVLPKNDDQ